MLLNIKGSLIDKATMRIEREDDKRLLLKFDTLDNKHQVQYTFSKLEEARLLKYLTGYKEAQNEA